QKAINELRIKLMEEGADKEIAALEAKYSELGLKVDEAMQKGLSKDLANTQLNLLTQDFDKEKKAIEEKYRLLAEKEYQTILEEKRKLAQKLFEKETEAVEFKKDTKTAQENLDFLNQSSELTAQKAETTDSSAKEAIQFQLENLELLHKNRLLAIEENFLKEKLKINEKYGVLTTEQQDVIKQDLEQTNAQRTANEREQNTLRTEANRSGFKATLAAAGSYVNALGDLQNAIGEDSGAWIDFKNAITLAQIAIDTASAISALTSASSSNPTNAVTFGAAGAAQFAAGIVKITANMAQAYQLLAGAKKPKAPKSKAADAGGYFFDGGDTGGSSIYEERGVVHGKEYVIPNWLRKAPQVARFEKIVESVRVSKDLSKL
ncbi:MAG: hypothetical protein ACOVQA_07985, partial [Thermoflexibacteraceae bacterium]